MSDTPGYSEEKAALVKRLHRIEGQVRGVERMVEEDRYCIDILTQISAVTTALESVAFRVLDAHVQHCVADALASGDAGCGRVEELGAARGRPPLRAGSLIPRSRERNPPCGCVGRKQADPRCECGRGQPGGRGCGERTGGVCFGRRRAPAVDTPRTADARLESRHRGAPRTAELRSDPTNLIRVMPAKGAEMERETPAWGIEPVPERLRVLGLVDTTLLWANLGVSLLVLVAGTFLVPALSLRDALIAIAIGGVVGNTMLGLAGAIGSQGRVPAMVLMRAPLGLRGSYLATALNVLQNLGWAVFELIVIAAAAAALSDSVFGFEAKWLWTILFGVLAAVLALAGPVAFVRRWVRRFAFWVVLASLVYPHLVDARPRRPRRVLGRAGTGRVAVVRHRPDDRAARLVASARRRLHALHGQRARRVHGHGGRLSRPERVAVRARRAARAHEQRIRRHDVAADGDRLRRARGGARAARADRGRDGRGVRERLLDGRVAPERRLEGARSAF